MHRERYEIAGSVINRLLETKRNGGRIVAAGTTSLRALEAWAQETGTDLHANLNKTHSTLSNQNDQPHRGDTDIFITPGFQFKAVDCLITNFHLPKSTLLMLVSAFAGVDQIQAAYAHAIAQEYRFFSYGDAMWLNRLAQKT